MRQILLLDRTSQLFNMFTRLNAKLNSLNTQQLSVLMTFFDTITPDTHEDKNTGLEYLK